MQVVGSEAQRASSTAQPALPGLSPCAAVEKYGGFYFETQAPRASVFVGAEAVEFWARGDGGSGLPTNLVLRLGSTAGVRRVDRLAGPWVAWGRLVHQGFQAAWTA